MSWQSQHRAKAIPSLLMRCLLFKLQEACQNWLPFFLKCLHLQYLIADRPDLYTLNWSTSLHQLLADRVLIPEIV